MQTKARTLSCLALVMTTLAITSCGAPAAPAQDSAATAGGDHRIATLRIQQSVTREAILAATPGAQILSFDPAAGYAILSLPGQDHQTAGTGLSGQSLRALGVQTMTVEADVRLSAPGDPQASGLGINAWAGGINAWAGGINAWAGGANILPAADWDRAVAYWSALGLPQAQQLVPERGLGVRVAVLDTGVDLGHTLLQGRIDAASGWDYVDGDAVPQEEQSGGAKYGHGTAVTGVILQIAPNAKIVPLRVLGPDGSAPVSRVVQAIDRAVASGARVINLSLGAAGDSVALNTVIAGALAQGVLVVNSSGNDGTEGMVYPARNVGSLTFPASSGLLAVGSVGPGLYKSDFTNYGANMSLTAPGEEILTTFPGNQVARATGTSFAAPAVSGALALAMSAGVTSPARLVTDLRATARAHLDPTFKSKLGAGTLNVAAFVDTYR
ncbi:S8 family serine peptidase [Deinococcus aestuarii]|uniref:S8 family serine peptidase n=1 Tax=Deinococcus aestuarii TaxID=2774531 RepID=UPI001C0B0AC5|nr:S8 family serine peptidase [Deinococcus aestuarii]